MNYNKVAAELRNRGERLLTAAIALESVQPGKRTITKEGRERIAEAQRLRWAKLKRKRQN